MTREEIIEYWEQFSAEIDDLYDTCSDAERGILEKQREVVKFTISALRELDAQEKQEPLTLDELRQMDGEPVWCASMLKDKSEWAILRVVETRKGWYIGLSGAECAYGGKESYEETWLAYQNKPKEEIK